MKALGKLLGDFVTWRWAPAVGLCVASLFYVLVVVALVPNEIGVPGTDTRLAKKRAPADEKPELPTFSTTTPERETETESALPPPSMPVQPAGVVDFGRRGFSPPLERPEPPPAPPPPVVMQAPPVAAPPPVPEAPAPAEAPPAVITEAPSAAPPGQTATPHTPAGIMRQMQAFRGLTPRNSVPNAPGQQPPPGEVPPAPSAAPSE